MKIDKKHTDESPSKMQCAVHEWEWRVSHLPWELNK